MYIENKSVVQKQRLKIIQIHCFYKEDENLSKYDNCKFLVGAFQLLNKPIYKNVFWPEDIIHMAPPNSSFGLG